MRKEYSPKEIERILKQNIEIPGAVEDRIQQTYETLGMEGEVTMRYTKKHKVWAAVAAVAILTVGISVVTVAASKFLTADLLEKEGSVQYNFQVDKDFEAHEISVEPTYMPKGYELGDENSPYGGKWHNYDTDGGITIIPLNAAELDRIERTGGADFLEYPRDEHIKEMEISGMKTNVFVSDSFYMDSEKTTKNLYLFNEEYGYGVQIFSYSDLPAEELIKVAEGLEITVLDTVVPYATDEELAAEKEDEETYQSEEEQYRSTGVIAERIFEIGDEVRDPLMEADLGDDAYQWDDIRFTVEEVQIKDALPADEYPVENYISYEEIQPWMNEDGSLKAHERYRYTEGQGESEKVLETASSKYVVVKMKAKNCGTTASDWNKESGVSIAPDLTTLTPREDGNYSYPESSFMSANEGYSLQWYASNGSSFPVYFDQIYYTEGTQRLKHALFRPIEPGEELEYTLAYVADEDQLDNLYLWFFPGTGGTAADGTMIQSPYVRISE